MVSKQKVGFIGPIDPPFRGGIAQYSSSITNALEKEVSLKVYSFRTLYPKLLYPGESDKTNTKKKSGVRYVLSIYSPISWKKTADKIVEDGCESLIISWWTMVWMIPLWFVAKRVRRKGVKVFILAHNLFDHDKIKIGSSLPIKILGVADGYIVHSLEQKKLLNEFYPDRPVLQRVHPIYNHFPKPDKKRVETNKLNLLFFGFVREYKGLDLLLEAIRDYDLDVNLVVAGEAWGKDKELVESLAKQCNGKVKLALRYMSEQEAANLFHNCDVVVLPYKSATGSGVVTLAYHYNRPVLATRVGGLKEAVIDGETGWLCAPNCKDLASSINSINKSESIKMRKGIKNFKEINSWSGMASSIRKIVF